MAAPATRSWCEAVIFNFLSSGSYDIILGATRQLLWECLNSGVLNICRDLLLAHHGKLLYVTLIVVMKALQRWREQLTQAVKELVRGQRIFHCRSNIVDKLMLQVYLFIVWNFKYSHLEMQSNRREVYFSLDTYWLSILEQSSWSLYAAASK